LAVVDIDGLICMDLANNTERYAAGSTMHMHVAISIANLIKMTDCALEINHAQQTLEEADIQA
jgi:hypothetical protein